MIKGINQDFSQGRTPDGYAFFVKNMLGQRKYDALVNEKGTAISVSISNLNVKDFIGEIVFQSKIIIFYITNNAQTNIAVIDENLNTVTVKLVRTDLGFNKDNPIFGKAKLNSRGQLIVAYTDRAISPKYINLDTALTADDKDIYELFLRGKQPFYTSSIIDNGGVVKGGAYFAAIQYIDTNKCTTDWTRLSSPIYVTNAGTLTPFPDAVAADSGTTTNKAIKLELSGLDTAFKRFKLAFIKVNKEVISASIIKEVDYTGSHKDVVYTGTELETPITVEEIVTKNFSFDHIDTITSLTDILYIGGAYNKPEADLQTFFNGLAENFFWKSKLVVYPFEVDPTQTAPEFSKDGNKRTLIHGEVYALYGRVTLDGKQTRWFHIPGRALTDADRSTSSADAQFKEAGDVPPKKFRYDDTCTIQSMTGSGDTREGTGKFGVWENENEVYGPNFPGLAGQKVRHFKTPSITFLRGSVFNADLLYGVRKWDQLSMFLRVHTSVPPEYRGRISDIEIGYAERDEGSTTLLGYSISQLMGTATYESAQKVPTGGNWNLDYQGGSDELDVTFSGADNKKLLRLNSPDIMINKPNITSIYTESILKTSITVGNHDSSRSEPYGRIVSGAVNNIYSFLSNFFQFGENASTPSSDRFCKLYKTKYIPRGVVLANDATKRLDNTNAEECLYGELLEGHGIDVSEYIETNVDGNNHSSPGLKEEVILTAIKVMRTDVFNSYLNQRVIPLAVGGVGVTPNSTQGEISFSTEEGGEGDGFICTHSYMTLAHVNSDKSPAGGDVAGIKCQKLVLLESRFNLNQRYEVQSDISTYFFPSGAYRNVNSNLNYWFNGIIQDSTPVNVIKLSKDFSQENIFDIVDIYDHSQDYESNFPHLIARSQQASRETGIEDGWRIFRPNDYFYTIRDRGKIVNLEGVSNDSLLIHHEDGLFRTRGNIVLKAGINDISLGKGDIFEIEPKETSTASYGHGGTRHKFSCQLTEAGYSYVDQDRGEIFLYDFNQLILLTKGIKNILYDYFLSDQLVKQDNPYQGRGISTGYDRENYRLLFSLRGTNSLTFSYDLTWKEWRSFHDYTPQKLINTRKSLFAISGNELHKHGIGPRGRFYGVLYPSYVDIVVNDGVDQEKILAAIRWISNVVVNGNANKYDQTITGVTIWNENGCTGKIDLTTQPVSLYEIQDKNVKNDDNTWQFDQIMDIVKDHNQPFINNIFNDYRPISTNLDNTVAWYEQVKFRGKYFIVRLEYSNFEDKEVYLQKLIPEIRASR